MRLLQCWSLLTKRVKLVVAYDGTDFCGWAANAGHRTVQGTLTEAVRRVSGEDCEIVGASRTDSGAHAKGQVCHFDVRNPMKTEDWARVLNRVMDEDIRVLTSSEVSPEFHSRFCAHARHYRYRILNTEVTPFNLRYAHYWWGDIDVEEMSRAARTLEGEHNFKAFTQDLQPTVENTTRTLFSVKVKRVRNEVWIDIAGTAFLRGMMRRISGCLLEIGRGRRQASDLVVLLSDQRDSIHWPEVLPAKGLTLMRITYGRHPKDHRTDSEED